MEGQLIGFDYSVRERESKHIRSNREKETAAPFLKRGGHHRERDRESVSAECRDISIEGGGGSLSSRGRLRERTQIMNPRIVMANGELVQSNQTSRLVWAAQRATKNSVQT